MQSYSKLSEATTQARSDYRKTREFGTKAARITNREFDRRARSLVESSFFDTYKHGWMTIPERWAQAANMVMDGIQEDIVMDGLGRAS